MRRLYTVSAVVVLLAACSQAATDGTDPTPPPPPAETSSTTTTAAPTTTNGVPPDSPCLTGDRPFSSSGVISAFGGATGDAAQISSLRAGEHPGCERVVVDLLTADGAPAGSLGLVGVEYDQDVGIVRIKLPPTVSRTAIADSLFDGALAERAYVVRTGDGNLAVDIHVVAGAAVALRAFEVDAPSRIVVDLRPDPDASPVRGATRAGDVVVIEPAPGPARAPLTIAGYARGSTARVFVRLHESRETEAIWETTAITSGTAEAWAEFATMATSLPNRQLSLYVANDSPRGGSDAGVWIAVDARVAD